jgi:hypothetical protein
MSLLDDIAAEVSQLTDEEIAAAAASIMARKTKEKARMTPERIQAGKDREKKRRMTNAAILALAKEKGIVPASPAVA